MKSTKGLFGRSGIGALFCLALFCMAMAKPSLAAFPHMIFPNAAGIVLEKGKTYNIQWGSVQVDEVQIGLCTEVSSDEVDCFRLIAVAPNTGSYSWTVPGDIPDGSDYLIAVGQVGVSVAVSDNAFTIGGAVPHPDLAVSNIQVSDATPEANASFTVNATVSNQGDATASSTTLRYYRSTDSTISNADTEIGTDAIPSLAAGSNSGQNLMTSIATAGTYWIGACVDAVASETQTSNNCSSGVQVTVTPPPPDLVVPDLTVTDSTPNTGDSFTIDATVENQGAGPAASTTLRYYRSADSTISTADTEIDTDGVPGLQPAETSPESLVASIPSAGTYWVGACVDTVSFETATSNNCSAGVQVVVSDAPPDLIVTAQVSETAFDSDQTITFEPTVINQGPGASGTTTLRYYLAANGFTIPDNANEYSSSSVPGLSPGGQFVAPSVGLQFAAGSWSIGACVDPPAGEVATGNNCSEPVHLTVSVPDIEICAGVFDAPSADYDLDGVSNSDEVDGGRNACVNEAVLFGILQYLLNAN